MTPTDSLRWVRSSYSSHENDNCVEWAPEHALVHRVIPVRDSKTPDAHRLMFGPDAWSAFIGTLKDTPL
jgi:hypothetical protein